VHIDILFSRNSARSSYCSAVPTNVMVASISNANHNDRLNRLGKMELLSRMLSRGGPADLAVRRCLRTLTTCLNPDRLSTSIYNDESTCPVTGLSRARQRKRLRIHHSNPDTASQTSVALANTAPGL
jgi:hypothetical protein